LEKKQDVLPPDGDDVHDHQLDVISGLVRSMKDKADIMEHTLIQQNEMADELNDKLEKTNAKMAKSNREVAKLTRSL